VEKERMMEEIRGRKRKGKTKKKMNGSMAIPHTNK
jgi:hypothetical protein